MFTKMILSTLAACLVALGACGGGAAKEAKSTQPETFRIVYERGGGFAPSTSRLVVRPGRHTVAETAGTRAGEQRVRFRLAAKRIAALERDLAGAGFGDLESPHESTCFDCFTYEIAYRGNRIHFNQAQIPDGLDSVVGELESIVTSHAIPPNA